MTRRARNLACLTLTTYIADYRIGQAGNSGHHWITCSAPSADQSPSRNPSGGWGIAICQETNLWGRPACHPWQQDVKTGDFNCLPFFYWRLDLCHWGLLLQRWKAFCFTMLNQIAFLYVIKPHVLSILNQKIWKACSIKHFKQRFCHGLQA